MDFFKNGMKLLGGKRVITLSITLPLLVYTLPQDYVIPEG